MPETQSLTSASPLAVLANRARSVGHEPWLFHRDDWDWIWRSWAQVADQVTRGAEVLRTASPQSSLDSDPRKVGYVDDQDPDAITVGLAIRAAGKSAMPIRGGPREAADRSCDVWVEVGEEDSRDSGDAEGLERIVLPPVIDALDRTPLRPLGLDDTQGSIFLPDLGKLKTAKLMANARSLDRRLPAPGQRPIVCAAPDLESRDARLLETWTLISGAAWVLEPEPSAFLATVLWARPTIVWARAATLARLASKLKIRRHRRESRLSAVVVTGGDVADPEPWRKLDIEIVRLDEFSTGL